MAVARFDLDGESNVPVGIGGWLLIPIIFLVLSVAYAVLEVIQGYEDAVVVGLKLWHAFVTPGTVLYHSTIVLEIFLSVLFQIVLIVLSCIALVALFKKKKYAPKIAVLVYVVGLCFALFVCYVVFIPLANISAELSGQIAQESVIKLVTAFVNAAIWIPYFRKSRRVAGTFTKD